jgi:Diacylglycerol kinase
VNSAGSALSWKRWWRSAGFAWAGIAHSYRTQPNFRIETWAAVLALALTAWLRAPLAPIALACALVLALELVNTAVEAVVDLVSPEPHPLAGVAKDAAAAAVLLASLGAVVVGLAVLGPPLWAWVSRL